MIGGGAGADTLMGGLGPNTIFGGADNDLVLQAIFDLLGQSLSSQADHSSGGIIWAGSGSDNVYGDQGRVCGNG
jgi:hypothetical protein